jgi:sigma-B regulation protein RsbU (phosphoserine phosphatase)
MVATRANLRAEAEYMYRVRDIVARVNRALLRDTRPHEFVTLFYAALNTTARVLTYTNAGHPPPILLRRDEERFLKEGGPPLGLLREAPYQEEQAQLQRGDVILLYTDGVIETSGENQEFFGEERLFRALRDHRDVPAAEILFHILISISAFASGLRQRDDLTLVVIKVK